MSSSWRLVTVAGEGGWSALMSDAAWRHARVLRLCSVVSTSSTQRGDKTRNLHYRKLTFGGPEGELRAQHVALVPRLLLPMVVAPPDRSLPLRLRGHQL